MLDWQSCQICYPLEIKFFIIIIIIVIHISTIGFILYTIGIKLSIF